MRLLKEAVTEQAMAVVMDEPMALHTSLKIGGPVDVLATPADAHALGLMMARLAREGVTVLPLGGGTNLLVQDGGIEGVALSMTAFRQLAVVREDNQSVLMEVGAGLPLGRLVAHCRRMGYEGLSGLAGVPGHVGGAVAGNAGAWGDEMGAVVQEVLICDREGRQGWVSGALMGFTYRGSALPQGAVIVSARILLKKANAVSVAQRMDECLMKKKSTQPLAARTAGCVFKNPAGDSAGRLMDACGCKGMREGAVEVSRVHANFFVNLGGASARDFMRLMERVSQRVMATSGTALEPEIKVVGRC